jgi:hypothetical protein
VVLAVKYRRFRSLALLPKIQLVTLVPESGGGTMRARGTPCRVTTKMDRRLGWQMKRLPSASTVRPSGPV